MIIDITTNLFVILFFFASLCVYIYRVFKEERTRLRYFVVVSFIFYIIALVKVVLFPIFIFDKELISKIYEGSEKYIRFYQFIPFASIKDYFSAETIIQLIGNVFLLFPLVIYVDLFSKGKYKIINLVMFGVCSSLLIEIYQLLTNFITKFPGHLADIDDFLLNSIGVLFAAGVIAIIRKKKKFITKLLWVSKS